MKQERFNSIGKICYFFLELNKKYFLAQRCRTIPLVPLEGTNVSQSTFMLNSCANELPSVFLSFSIDIPAAASTHHSHSSAPMESNPTSAQRKHVKLSMGPQKRGPKVLKRLTFSHCCGQLIVKYGDSAPF